MSHVHPTAVIAPGVRLGERVTVGPHAVIYGPCELGEDAWIGAGAILGSPPGDVGAPHRHWDEPTGHGVVVGARAIVREHAQVETGRDGPTIIGPDAFVMPHAHLSHDCLLGAHVIIGSGAVLGGTVRVLDHVFVGLNASVHQGVVIGAHAVVGLQSAVVHDIPPFARAAGSPARILGANHVGMRRRGLAEHVAAVEAILRGEGTQGDEAMRCAEADTLTAAVAGAHGASVAAVLADRYAEFAAVRGDTDRKLARIQQ